MTHLVRFLLDDGESIFVEVDEQESGATKRASSVGNVIEDAQQNFKQALSSVRSATEAAIIQLRDLHTKPNEIEMEFGFNLSGEFGAIIAKVTTEANYKVTLRWKSEEQESKP